MKIIFDWIKENKIISGIFFVIGQVITALIISKVTELNLTNAIKFIWGSIFNFFKTILDFNVPVWVIIIVIFLLYVIDKIITKRQESKNDSSWYANYTEDTYKGVLYTWYYHKTYDGKIDFVDYFKPICIYCRGDLTTKREHNDVYYPFNHLYCPNCNKILETPSQEDFEDAKIFVRNKLKKKFEQKLEENKSNKK